MSGLLGRRRQAAGAAREDGDFTFAQLTGGLPGEHPRIGDDPDERTLRRRRQRDHGEAEQGGAQPGKGTGEKSDHVFDLRG